MTDELVYRRVLRAPRKLVWRCLTEPAELARLWGPAGGDHGRYHMVATFTEVVPPGRLAWVEPPSGMHTTSRPPRSHAVVHSLDVTIAVDHAAVLRDRGPGFSVRWPILERKCCDYSTFSP